MKGNHLITDIINVDCASADYCEKWLKVLKEQVINNGLKIINSYSHIFLPPDLPGFTGYILIDASHFAIHTYTDEKKIALDLFSCGNVNTMFIFESICKHFAITKENIKSIHYIERF